MKNFKILLVDDNKHFLEAFEFMLNDAFGQNITSIHKVYNGRECLNFLENNYVDIVFMDIDMPELNGIEATRAIIDRFRFIHVIAVSFHNEMESIQKMIEAGARNYLVKEDINKVNLLRVFNSFN